MSAALAGVPRAPVDDVVDFYVAALREADSTLLDSAGQKPQYRRVALGSFAQAVAASVTTHYGAQWRPSRVPCAANPTLSNILRSWALGPACAALCFSSHGASLLAVCARCLVRWSTRAQPCRSTACSALCSMACPWCAMLPCNALGRPCSPRISKPNPKPRVGFTEIWNEGHPGLQVILSSEPAHAC